MSLANAPIDLLVLWHEILEVWCFLAVLSLPGLPSRLCYKPVQSQSLLLDPAKAVFVEHMLPSGKTFLCQVRRLFFLESWNLHETNLCFVFRAGVERPFAKIEQLNRYTKPPVPFDQLLVMPAENDLSERK